MNLRMILLASSTLWLAGCGTLLHGGGYVDERRGASSSLVEFLYPDGETPPAAERHLPQLELPLRVGIAFVPSHHYASISEAEKQTLMARVAAAFEDRPYIEAIELIPDTYLRTAHGVRGMQQIAGMFDADVMALVSYDQISASGERDSALLYWTVVGAMFVKGNTNEVQTMIDTAVFDVQSGRLLFRAPGLHASQRNATLIDKERDLRSLQSDGFSVATDNMIPNLNHELEQFRTAVREGKKAEVAWRPGSSGGGSTGLALLVLLGAVFAVRLGRSSTVSRCRASRWPHRDQTD